MRNRPCSYRRRPVIGALRDGRRMRIIVVILRFGVRRPGMTLRRQPQTQSLFGIRPYAPPLWTTTFGAVRCQSLATVGTCLPNCCRYHATFCRSSSSANNCRICSRLCSYSSMSSSVCLARVPFLKNSVCALNRSANSVLICETRGGLDTFCPFDMTGKVRRAWVSRQ